MENFISEKYRDNLIYLKDVFPEAYDFLKLIEGLEHKGFHMGTAVNMHFYYKENFLFYFRFRPKYSNSGNPVTFSPYYNLRLKRGTLDGSDLFFKPLMDKIEKENLISDGKVELKSRKNKSGVQSFDIFVYQAGSKFFKYCEEVIYKL